MSVGIRSPGSPTPCGFTLLEAIVALAISGIILAGSAALVGALADATAQVQETAERMAAPTNAERTLLELAANLVPTEGAEVALTGSGSAVAFDSRCPRPGGWLAPCPVVLAIDSGGIRVARGGREAIVLPLRDRPSRFLYLVNAAGGGTWAARWESVVPPLAIGVQMDDGMLVFPIGVQR